MIDMELGPIRPPSEAESLMLRVTRGCHWNKCYFCDLYKKYKFSRRRYEEIEEDLKKAADSEYAQNYTTCFLQDGDAFVLQTEFLMQILEGIHKYLPNIKHVTTYARADSIARKSVSELRELKTAGIEHLYCGMETGSDLILRKINKGFDTATIIISGTKAKEAGMVLSEFTLFGIGGKELAEENAVETAKVLNVIKPDFVRVHATGIKLSSEMWNYVKNKELTLQSEEEIVSEQKIMLELLADDMDCIYMNEHIVNLLLEVRGNIRTDKQNMLETINTYLQLPKQEQELFNLGRRLNIMFFLADLNNRAKRKQTEEGLRKIKTQNPDLDSQIAKNFFLPPESERICAQTDAAKGMEKFYEIWTVKEAFVKALGHGLSRSLKSFEVLEQGTINDYTNNSRYNYYTKQLSDNYLCSLVVV